MEVPPARLPKKSTRRNHYTPVLYLRNFADANGALHVVNRQVGHRRESSPEAIGFEKDLYRPDDLQEGEDPEAYEKAFREFEGEVAPVIQQIIRTRAMPTDDEDLGLLYNFIAPLFISVDDDFSIRVRAELMSGGDELGPKFLEVVDFTVEGDPDGLILIAHGLMASR